MNTRWRAIAVLGTVALGGCNLIDPPACTLNIVPGIVVTIVDSMSGEPRAAAAFAEARAGGFADTLDPGGFQGQVMTSRSGAWERVGIYDVVVRAPGYGDWRRSVIVRSNSCHVITEQLRAELQPDPAVF